MPRCCARCTSQPGTVLFFVFLHKFAGGQEISICLCILGTAGENIVVPMDLGSSYMGTFLRALEEAQQALVSTALPSPTRVSPWTITHRRDFRPQEAFWRCILQPAWAPASRQLALPRWWRSCPQRWGLPSNPNGSAQPDSRHQCALLRGARASGGGFQM